MQPEGSTVEGMVFLKYFMYLSGSRFGPKPIGSGKPRPAPVASASPRARILPAVSKKRRGVDYSIATRYAHVKIIRLGYDGR